MTDEAGRLAERVLVLRAQTGDGAAFAALVESYRARLAYFLRKLLGGGEVDDLLQDVWYDVFRSLPRLQDAAAFPAWLYRVARDRAYRRLRRSRPPTVSLDGVDPADPDEGPAYTAEDAARVHAGLDRLSPEHREVLVLRFLEDMSYDDIARVVGCPGGTVRSRLHHARAALRRVLERSDRDE
jgi:RNA polymerase sigma-70 factor (ECF subfamily)